MYLKFLSTLAGAAAIGMMTVVPGAVHAAPPADWSSVPTKTLKLIFPGQSSYEWTRSKEHKKANRKVEKGKACYDCHEGEEADVGNKLAAGERLEPHPIKGKPGVINLAIQAAHDAQNLYLRFQWKTKNSYPGSAHPHWMFDGKEWKQIGWPRLDKHVWEDGKPAIYEDRLSIMLDDGKVPLFAEQGCWITCHTGMRDMPDQAAKADVQAHALLGKALHKSDVRKFLPASRDGDDFTWKDTKSAADIAKIKAAGGFLDLWQWRAHRSNPIGMADDGYVLEYRLFDAGKKMFSKNWDKKTHLPMYMFDAKKVGFKAHTMDMIRDASKAPALIKEDNAVPFDPKAGWKKGDMIPEYYLTRGVEGSAGDNNNVKGTWKDGMWTVVFTRKLDTGHPEDDKIMKKGGVYTIAFAVHDDNITTRGHNVSYPQSLGIGVDADIKAVTVP